MVALRPLITTLRPRARLCALLVALGTAALVAGCGIDPGGLVSAFDSSRTIQGKDAAAVETFVQRYYEAVQRKDQEAQLSMWTRSQQKEAQREADRWAKRDTSGLRVYDFHVQATEWPDHIIVHFYEALASRKSPASRVGLLQKVDKDWLIKELR